MIPVRAGLGDGFQVYAFDPCGDDCGALYQFFPEGGNVVLEESAAYFAGFLVEDGVPGVVSVAVLVRGRGAVEVVLAEAFLFDFLIDGASRRVLGVHFGLPRVWGRIWFSVWGTEVRGSRSGLVPGYVGSVPAARRIVLMRKVDPRVRAGGARPEVRLSC